MPDTEQAGIFYGEGLGLAADPGSTAAQRGGVAVTWFNIGRQQVMPISLTICFLGTATPGLMFELNHCGHHRKGESMQHVHMSTLYLVGYMTKHLHTKRFLAAQVVAVYVHI